MFGRREEVTMSVINLVDNYRRDLKYYLKFLFSKDLRKELNRTKELQNVHKGKRCFIVGNGPSLKHHNLNHLTNEFVFTVNYMMKSNDFKTLNSNYHLFFDPIVFGLDPKVEEDKEKIDMIDSTLKSNPDMTYIIPYRRRANFIKLFPKHKFKFIYNYKTFTPQLKNPSQLHRITPGFQNVIIYAINSAIYMGFKEIYLIGVDMTGFLEHFEYNKVNNQWGHSYTKTEEEIALILETLKKKNIDNEFYLKTYGKTLEHLKLMFSNATENGVKLMNASNHGAIDFLPRVEYDALFSDNSQITN
ncbi:6-hydroxymethylpterin diphosphokinase MptE-like protein [Winogradskyella schleiferi]|uniref:6-hydroxymethylpterin diphosphokinase MptE-like protein n=1 Tax=Winogradskyella schleiferi TaxID=2686078 RepID=UPI0015BF0897|nr:6-hydroxymethylpterin diphosphokinase MptE-like protein [Winogradskyella schleiferi]